MTDDVDDLFPTWECKSQCYTAKNKYPRTTYFRDFVDWSRSPIHDGRNLYSTPNMACEPGPPWRRFRPLPPIKDSKEDRRVRTELIKDPRGIRTPEDSFHFGFKHFTRDAARKHFRHHSDPIPFPLATEKRVAFQAPNARSHLLPEKRSIQRYGAKARSYSIGITPRTLSIPPVFPSGDPADW